MAGWRNRDNKNDKASIKLSKLSNLGLTFSDEILKNIKSVTPTQFTMLGNQTNVDRDLLYSLQINDVTSNLQQALPIFQENYVSKRDFLRKFSTNNEITNIINTVCDQSIVYDDNHYCCHPKFNEANLSLQKDVLEDVKNAINLQFKRIYTNWGFKNSNMFWRMCRKFLIDGYLAFEIVWDASQKNILGFVELDAAEIQPIQKEVDGEFKKFWLVYPNHINHKKELSDSQIIFISWQKINDFSKLSYADNLVRSYNLLRLMEDTRVIWAVTNATFRLKMVFPQGELSSFRERENIQKMLNAYKEDIQYTSESGDLKTNGKAGLMYYKNYVMASKGGEQPEIDVLAGDGPELNDTDILTYFSNKLYDDSQIPRNRFLRDGTATWQGNHEGIAMEEIKFSNFIEQQIRSNLIEIMLKPLRLQLLAEFDFLKDNEDFITNLSIDFENDMGMYEMRETALFQERASLVETLGSIMDTQGNSPLFAKEFLIRRYFKLSPDEWEQNKKFLSGDLGKDYLGNIDDIKQE